MKQMNEIARLDVRVSKEDGELIKKAAHDAGVSVNQYIKEKTLGTSSEPSFWKAKAASHMCRFWIVLDKMEDSDQRKKLTEWGNEMWQHLK